MKWASYTKDLLPEESGDKLVSLVKDLPKSDRMVHADYHTKNLELQDGEVLLIDMDTLAVGDPVFDFAAMYNAFIGFSEYDHGVVKEFQGFDFETSCDFWHRTLAAYFETEDEEKLKEVEDKARVLSYARLIRRSAKRGGLEDPKKKEEIELWKSELVEVLGRVGSLSLGSGSGKAPSNEIDVEANDENLYKVMEFVGKCAEAAGASPKAAMELDLAVEEIFVNIARYAYAPGTGRAKILAEVSDDCSEITVTFIDGGMRYNPLDKEDPDVTLPAEERPTGGLGVFMVKNIMDGVSYAYRDGKNILSIRKRLK